MVIFSTFRSVTTNRDECNDVRLLLIRNLKCLAINLIEEIV